MDIPMISVIIPIYNVEKYIKRCLDSLLSQTFRNFEVVLVNDATPDKSMSFVIEFCKEWKYVTIVEHKKNMGQMCARKSGYQNANGNYFVFLDSDDWLPPNALEKLFYAIENSDADVVCGFSTFINDDGPIKIMRNYLKYGNLPENVYKSMLNDEFSHTLWGKIFNASLFRQYSYDNFECFTNGEDGLLFYQLLANTKNVSVISENVYFYYQNMNSCSNVELSNRSIEAIVILNVYRARLKKKYPSLSNDFNRKITTVLINLIYTTKKRSLIFDLVKRFHLMYYVENTSILKNFSFVNAVKLLIKKYF